MQAKTSTVSIIGIVLAIIALLIAFIPCIGTLALFPAAIALILSIVGFNQDKNSGASTTSAIVGIVCGALALLVSGSQAFFLGKAGNDISKEVRIEYKDCDELLADFEKTAIKMKAYESMDENDIELSEISTLVRLTTRIANIKSKSETMDCTADEEFNKRMEEITQTLEE
jgi:hypothetical protein